MSVLGGSAHDAPVGVVSARDLLAGVVDVAVIGLDTAGTVISWNAGAHHLLGYPAQDVAGKHFSAFYTAEDRSEGVPAALLDTASTTGRAEIAGWQMRRDRTRFRAEGLITAARQDGRPTGYAVIIRDVSERYELEHLLRESEVRFGLLVSQVVDYAIIALDRYGVIASWNAGAETLKGYTAEEAIGQHFSMFYPEEDKAAGLPTQLLATAVAERRVEHTGWRVRKDGSRFWGDVVITALHDENGVFVGYAKVTRDLTEQHQLQESLRASEARFRLLVSQVVDYAIIALDRYGVIASWNAGAETLKGYTAEEAIGQHFSMFYPEENKASGLPLRLLSAAEREGRVEHAGWRVRKDGTRFWGDVIITALRDEQGELTGFAKVTRDRSEQHRLEAARATLFAAVSHDLRAPVFAIESYALLLARADADERRLYAEQITANAHRVAAMVDGLFDYAKIRAGALPLVLEPLALGDVVRSAAVNLAHVVGVRSIEVVDTEVRALGDRAAMQRVVENLLSNAAKYSPEGSPIAVSVAAHGHRVRLAVTDHGRGIDADDLPTIFDEFSRGRLAEEDGGTGLGLASVKQLVAMQGGRVWIDSEVGVGTTVTVELAGDAAG